MLFQGADARQPRCKLAFHPRISPPADQLISWLHRSGDAVMIACKPGSFSVDCCKRADALQLGCRARERPRFFKRRTGIGVAAPNSQVPENPQRRNAADGRGARMPQHRFCIVACPVPIALFESRSRAIREHVEPPGIQVMFFAVGQPRGQILRCLVVLTAGYGHCAQVRIGARNLVLGAAYQREFESLLQIGPTSGVAADEPHRAASTQRVTHNLIIRPRLGEGDGPIGPPDGRVRRFVRFHVEVCSIAISHRQRRACRQRLERGDGIDGVLVRLCRPACEPAQAGQPPQGVAFLYALSRCSPNLQRRALRADGGLVLACQITLIRQSLQQICTLLIGKALRILQSDLIV